MNELVVFNEVTATLAEYKAENAKLVFNYADPEGEKQARSHISKLRKVKTLISNVHKEAKADALAFGRRLDGKKNELTAEVEGMIAVHKEPLDAIEAEKQVAIDAEKEKFEEAEEKRLLELEARERAVKEAEDKIAREAALEEREKREKRIAEEAAETARAQAEQKAKAEADAKELAEKNRIEAEVAKEQRRIANKKHRKKIENEIHSALTDLIFDPEDVEKFILALKENAIPHVKIIY